VFEFRNGKVATFDERCDMTALVAEIRSAQARV
jgi:hypothetical protein